MTEQKLAEWITDKKVGTDKYGMAYNNTVSVTVFNKSYLCNLTTHDPDNTNCQACDVISKCLKAFNQPQKEAADKVLLWGKKNIIGTFTYQNEAFGGKTASFVKNSFTENLRRGDLFFAKVDVLNNIKKYLGQNLHFEKEDAVHGSGTYFYKTTIKYLGNDPAGVGRDMELQFKEYPDGKIHFYFIKFI